MPDLTGVAGLPSEWGPGIRLESCLCGGRGEEERMEREEVLSISEVSDWDGVWSDLEQYTTNYLTERTRGFAKEILHFSTF